MTAQGQHLHLLAHLPDVASQDPRLLVLETAVTAPATACVFGGAASPFCMASTKTESGKKASVVSMPFVRDTTKSACSMSGKAINGGRRNAVALPRARANVSTMQAAHRALQHATTALMPP